MRIAIAQINPTVGDFELNSKIISEVYQRACSKQARLLLTPELGVCGYPPHDLIERPEIFDRNEKALAKLAAMTQGQKCALVVGHVSRNPSTIGRAAMNSVSVCENGKVVFTQSKSLLPTYDVFDEARYFEPASEIRLWKLDGVPVALAVCEDLWGDDSILGRHLYGDRDPLKEYQSQGARLVISVSASPYEWGKRQRREELHSRVAQHLHSPLIYVNQVGATDEILFDGASFAVGPTGNQIGRMKVFGEDLQFLNWNSDKAELSWEGAGSTSDPSEIETLALGLEVGIREYFKKTGFKKAIIGLSGGIDSAVVATLATRALGPKNVLGVAMPSQYSSGHSLTDAEILAKNLGIAFEVHPIKFLFSTASRLLGESRGKLAPIALENLQSRLRGMILMTLSNHENALVITTGNKSEMATGYCTLYGDMVGALAPIGDVLKTRVYELAHFLNRSDGSPIPENSITKPPSAELRPDQTDQDTLPPYDQLDQLMADYVERFISVDELEKRYGKEPWVRESLRRLEINEYKRRQAAPVLKTSHKAFGIGRRIPIAKLWEQ